MREGASYSLLVYGLLRRISCRAPEPFERGLEAEGEPSCLGELQQDLTHLGPAGSAYIQGTQMLNSSLQLGPQLGQTFLFQSAATGCRMFPVDRGQ